ncbi:DUF305 domain-containing protein [Streptosporangium sp. NPDC049376]|uniref:DUF305 domain-containing protein n=1 Tax=Streptosporangium sp. NPDC049376 TaxID=3366192 RepID=UPI00379107EA
MKRIVILALVLAAAGLPATGCGSTGRTTLAVESAPDAPAASTPAADHNGKDVMFAQMMIPHHRQAVEMAKLAEGRAASDQVKELAGKIEAAQEPEIRTMSGWLTAWGAQVPGERGMPMDHDMPGMMSGQAMEELKGLKGAAFDRAFLTMMIQHHEGAVAMAGQEQAEGVHEPARRMAADIVAGQSAEIATMRRLLR